MSDIIFLSNVRLSFPHLVEPQERTNKDTGKVTSSYNCDFVMPPDHPSFVQFMKKYGELALEKWKDKASAVMGIIQNDRKLRCFGTENDKISLKTLQPFDSYVGNAFISATKGTAPQMIQADGRPVDPNNTLAYQQLARALYAGCRVNAAVKPWLQQNAHGRGVRCDLVAVQFAGDDEPFGKASGPDIGELFGKVAAAPQVPAFPQAPMPAAPFQDGSLPSFLTK